jgi:hypothetical protein
MPTDYVFVLKKMHYAKQLIDRRRILARGYNTVRKHDSSSIENVYVVRPYWASLIAVCSFGSIMDEGLDSLSACSHKH